MPRVPHHFKTETQSLDPAAPPRGRGGSDALTPLPEGFAWKAAAVLVALVVIAYLPALSAGFIWNDNTYVTDNPALTEPGGLARIWFTLGATPQYYPLVFTTFWFEHQVWGLWAPGYHATNVLLHAGAALLLWQLLRRLGVVGAWLVAAVFALHPVHVESVAWITERKNVLSCVCYLASMLAYFRFAVPQPGPEAISRGESPDARARHRAYACAFACFLLALFSKTVTCSLPAAILVILWWKRGRVSMRDVVPLVPFFVAGIALASVTSYMERVHVNARGPEWEFSLGQRLAIAGEAPWFYLWKLLWPAELSFSYPRTVPDAGSLAVYLPLLAALGLVVGLVALRGRIGRGPAAAALLFGGSLLPALGLFNVYPMRYTFVADHYQYIASMAPIALIISALVRLEHARAVALRLRAAIALVLLAPLAVLTFRHAGVYRDAESLWADTLRKNPGSWLAHNQLGNLAFQQGEYGRALAHHAEVLRLRPEDLKAPHNIGSALLKAAVSADSAGAAAPLFARGLRFAFAGAAADCYRSVLARSPGDVEARIALGNCLAMVGAYDAAVGEFEQAVPRLKDPTVVYVRIAVARLQQGRFTQAEQAARAALAKRPGLADLRVLLATALEGQDRVPEALAEYEAVIRAQPGRRDAAEAVARLRGR